jgi:UDP-2,3-diacylglucosamine pyrophosphatase LpxH
MRRFPNLGYTEGMSTGRRKLKLVISDFHLSRGKWLRDGRRNPLEDFHQDQKFAELLDHYSSGENADAEVELIVNGDFFDPLAVIPLPDTKAAQKQLEFPIEVEEGPAVEKFRLICEGHPISMNAMREFLARGKRIVFRWGNHDAGLLWPGVQALLRDRLVPPRPEQIEFQREPYVFDRICVDHGHQLETIHQFDEERIFIRRRNGQGQDIEIQNLPFGSFFCLAFLNRLKLSKPYINNIYPIGSYLKLSAFIEPWTFLTQASSVAWFFIKMRFVTHPMRFARLRKTLKILAEIIRRPDLEEEAERLFEERGHELPYDTLILGHNHKATFRTFPGGKQYLNTGTWTPITSLDFGSLGHKLLRTYVLIEYVDGKPRAGLKIWNGRPAVAEDFV